MFRFDTNLRKKVLSLYTLKDVCSNNKTSFTIATFGYYFYLITASAFCHRIHLLCAKGLVKRNRVKGTNLWNISSLEIIF